MKAIKNEHEISPRRMAVRNDRAYRGFRGAGGMRRQRNPEQIMLHFLNFDNHQ